MNARDTRNESDIVDDLGQRVELDQRVRDYTGELGTVIGFDNWDLDQYPAVHVAWDNFGEDRHTAHQHHMDDVAHCDDITIEARASRRIAS